MPGIAVPALAAAALLVLAGAQKVADPTMTVGALRSLRLPGSPLLVRLGSLVEMAVGLAAVFSGGAVTWGLVALSYAAVAGFVGLALRSGTMIGTCGCFGVVGGLAAVQLTEPLATSITDDPAEGIVVVLLSALAVGLLYGAFVDLPRALAAARAVRPTDGVATR